MNPLIPTYARTILTLNISAIGTVKGCENIGKSHISPCNTNSKDSDNS